MRACLKRLLPLVAVCALQATGVLAQQSDRAPNLKLGDLVVTGFSGTTTSKPGRTIPRGKSAADFTFINPDGASARVFDASRADAAWDGRLIEPPLKFDVLAKDVGQVFGIALDDARPPNIYVSATSMFGLNLVGRRRDGGAERRNTGGPGAGWMKGQFGLDLQGGPGAIYKIDGRTGMPTLFANVTLDGVPNPATGLGNLAFDAAHRQLFVSDLYTGMIHRFDLSGKELGVYDHGTTALRAANLPVVAFDSKNRPNIGSERFDTRKPDSWGFAPAARRVWALAVHDGRLYYSVLSGPQIWSIGIERDGSFGRDQRWELDVPSQGGALAVTDIAFTRFGAIVLAQRAPIAASTDYSAFTRPAEPQVLRFSLKGPDDPPSPGRWKPKPEEYAVGYAGRQRNANGGVALGYGYGPDGAIDTHACDAVLWATGQNLRNNPSLASELERGGPLVVHGLQSGPENLVRGDDRPVISHRFVDYDGKYEDPRASGHLGSVRIYTIPCADAVIAQPAPAALPIPIPVAVPGGGDRKVCTPTCVCPPGTALKGKECVKTDACPPLMVPGPVAGQCICPQGTTLQGNQCIQTQGCSPGQALKDGVCVPIASMAPTGCKPPMIPGPTPGSCHCPLDMQMMSGQCVPPNECKPPLVFNPTTHHCECPQGTVMQNGTCVAQICPAPMVPGPCTCPEGTVLDGQFCVKATPIDLKVEKTGETSPPSDVPWYGWHLKVTNVGNAVNANGVITVSDVVPPGMEFDSASSTPPTDWTCNAPPTIPAGGMLTCTYIGGPASSGQMLSTIDIVAKALGNGPYPPFTNCATVAVGGGYADTNAANNQSCVTVTKPTQIGEIILKKEVVNTTAITLPNLPYPVTVNCGGADQNVNLYPNVPQTIGNVPVPGSCTVTENPPLPPNMCPPNTTPTWSTSINPSSPVSITSTSTTVTITNRFSCEPSGGTFVVKKVVTSNVYNAQVGGMTFPISVTCGGNASTYNLPDGGSQTINSLPIGTSCSVQEATLPPLTSGNCAIAGDLPQWTTTYSPSSSATIGTTPVTVTVANNLECKPGTGTGDGTLIVTKKVINNTTVSLPPMTFPVTYGCALGENLPLPGNLTLTDGVPQTVNNILANSVCSVNELPPPVPANVCSPQFVGTWTTSYSPPTVTIGSTPASIEVTNTLTCAAEGIPKSAEISTPHVSPRCPPPSLLNAQGRCECAPGVPPRVATQLTIGKVLQLPQGHGLFGTAWAFNLVCTMPTNSTTGLSVTVLDALPRGEGSTQIAARTCNLCTITEQPRPLPDGLCPPTAPFAILQPPTYSPSNQILTGVGSGLVVVTNQVTCSSIPPTCQPPLVLGPHGCQCPPGQTVIGGRCVQQPPRSLECGQGKVALEGACIPIPACQSPLVHNGNGVCGCPAGTSPGAVPGQCMCPKDKELKNGECLPKKARKEVEKKKDKKEKKTEKKHEKKARSCPEGTVRRNGKCVRRDQPGVSNEQLMRGIGTGIGIMRGLGGRGGGGAGGGGGGFGGGGGKR